MGPVLASADTLSQTGFPLPLRLINPFLKDSLAL